MPWPLLCALETSVLSVDVEPESQEIPEDEFGVANAEHETCQICADGARRERL